MTFGHKKKTKTKTQKSQRKSSFLSTTSSSSEEEDSNSNSDSGSDEEVDEDDGHPWFGCVCGKTHDTFWIQCERCNSWYNNSTRCIGYGEHEAQNGDWRCPDCSSPRHGEGDGCEGEEGEESSSLSDNGDGNGNGDRDGNGDDDGSSSSDVNHDDGLGKTPHAIHKSDLKSLDNKTLLGPLFILTERSVKVISRLLTYFLQRASAKSNFNTDLWIFVWNCLRYEQKLKGWELGWNSQLNQQTCGKKYYYIPKKSPQSIDMREGFDYFISKEAVVAHLCIVIRNVDANAFDTIGNDIIDRFVTRLSRPNRHLRDRGSERVKRLKRGYFHSIAQYEKDLFESHAKRQKENHFGTASSSTSSSSSSSKKGGCCEKNSCSNSSASSSSSSSSSKKSNDVDIIRLNQELLDAIATNDLQKCKSLCTKDTITYEQNEETPDYEEERGGLVRGLLPASQSSNSSNYDGTSTSAGTSTSSEEQQKQQERQQQQQQKIFMTNQYVEWQGDSKETAVLSYTRHDIDGGLVNKRKELRIWTKKKESWVNTFTCTFSVPSCMV